MRPARRLVFVAAACLILLASSSLAQDAPVPAADRAAPWARFLGEWRSVDPSGAPGRTRITCERGTGPNLLRIETRSSREGRAEEMISEAVVFWHPGRQAWVREEFSAWGSFHDGTVTLDERGMTYDFASFERDGVMHYRQAVAFTGADAFTWKVEQETAAGWVSRSESSFRRVVVR